MNSSPASTTQRDPAANLAAQPCRITLDDLASMSIDELTALYRGGSVPDSLDVLDGSPTCRMLRFVGPLGRGAVGNSVRRIAASGAFPWAGKSFEATSDHGGGGINRLRLMGQRRVFPFATRIEPSAMDGDPCIVLDYEQPENPWFIAKVHDELREVAPKVFLGPAMWKTKDEPALVLYFACDQN